LKIEFRIDLRRGRKALEVNNVIYWFKNTRAAVKRSEAKSRFLLQAINSITVE